MRGGVAGQNRGKKRASLGRPPTETDKPEVEGGDLTSRNPRPYTDEVREDRGVTPSRRNPRVLGLLLLRRRDSPPNSAGFRVSVPYRPKSGSRWTTVRSHPPPESADPRMRPPESGSHLSQRHSENPAHGSYFPGGRKGLPGRRSMSGRLEDGPHPLWDPHFSVVCGPRFRGFTPSGVCVPRPFEAGWVTNCLPLSLLIPPLP